MYNISHEVGSQCDFLALSMDKVSQHVVISQDIRQSTKTTNVFYSAPSRRHRRAKTVSKFISQRRDQCRREKPIIYKHGTQGGWQSTACTSRIQARCGTDAGVVERSGNNLQIVALNPHVAVSDNKNVMLCMVKHVQKIADL